MIRFLDHIERLPSTVPFVGPETAERLRQKPFTVRIGANENVFGPSPKAIAAMQNAASTSWCYGDSESYELKSEIAARCGVDIENIIVGEGIDGLLCNTVRMLVEPGVTAVTSLGAYPTFNFHVSGFGGNLVQNPYTDDREDLGGLIRTASKHDAGIVYFANPDNPMGTWWCDEEVSGMIEKLPAQTLLVLDEAYFEFASTPVSPPIGVNNPNVLRFRTFSKAYGLAGARIGYAIGHRDVVSAFNKIRNHFGVNRLGQIGALAALQDDEWLEYVKNNVASSRERIYQIARDNGLAAVPSATNFVAVDCGGDGVFAKQVLDKLIEQDIFIRMPFAEPGNRCIRVGVGTQGDLDKFETALPKALQAARGAV